MRFLFFNFIFLKFNFVFSEEKIAFIDINYIMNNSVSGKSINKFINDIEIKNNEFKEIEKIKLKLMKMSLFQKKYY